jgi:hypothetical protein
MIDANDLLDIFQAAQFLNVSETSLRRGGRIRAYCNVFVSGNGASDGFVGESSAFLEQSSGIQGLCSSATRVRSEPV